MTKRSAAAAGDPMSDVQGALPAAQLPPFVNHDPKAAFRRSERADWRQELEGNGHPASGLNPHQPHVSAV